MVFNSIGITPEKRENPSWARSRELQFRSVLKRPSQAWLLAVTGGVFQKFSEEGTLPENFDRADKALDRGIAGASLLAKDVNSLVNL
jgi:hypothetical protein